MGLIRSMGGMESEMSDVRILGEGSFVEDILRRAETEERETQTIQDMWSKEDLQRSIASWAGVPAEALLSTDRSRKLAGARSVLIHAAIDWLKMPGTVVGSWINLSSAGVTKARARGRIVAEKNHLLQWLKSKKVKSVP